MVGECDGGKHGSRCPQVHLCQPATEVAKLTHAGQEPDIPLFTLLCLCPEQWLGPGLCTHAAAVECCTELSEQLAGFIRRPRNILVTRQPTGLCKAYETHTL